MKQEIRFCSSFDGTRIASDKIGVENRAQAIVLGRERGLGQQKK